MPATRSNFKRQNEDTSFDPDLAPKSIPTSFKRYKGDDRANKVIIGYTGSQYAHTGRRLLPEVVEDLAATDPRGIWLSNPTEVDSAGSFSDVTYGQLANAVNRASRWINERVSSLEHGSQTLAYLGPPDSRYLIFIIAAVKAGHRLLLPSTRNAANAQCRLLEATSCTTILCAKPELQNVESMLSTFGAPTPPRLIHVVPEQHEILDMKPAAEYSDSSLFDKERRNPFVILHTSGTTGEPVPVELPHAYYAYEDALKAKFEDEGVITFTSLKSGVRCLYTGPLYHAGAILFTFMKSLFLKVTMVLPPASIPVTAQVVESCILHGRANTLGTAPSVLEELCLSPTGRKCLKNLRSIFCGSGPMPKFVGDTIISLGVNMHHIYGSTETALLPQLPLDDPVNDWRYFKFHPASGATFVPVGKYGLHELIIQRLHENAPQPCFLVFPDLKEYRTRDTFSIHPSKPDLWKFEGRLDDIITLTNGEKFCPSTAEELISRHADVADALIVGQGRFQPALIIAMHDPAKGLQEIIDSLWSVIEMANSQAPGYARIGKSFILVSNAPFSKTSKGTTRRHRTEELLRHQIDGLYDQPYQMHAKPHCTSRVQCSLPMHCFIEQAMHKLIVSEPHLSFEGDLFAYGLDSLKVAELVTLVNIYLKEAAKAEDVELEPRRIAPSMFYQNRSVSALTQALHTFFSHRVSAAEEQDAWRREHEIILERYTRDLPVRASLHTTAERTGPLAEIVMLTGSTGCLGGNLLHGLLKTPTTIHVYCLDRCLKAKTIYLRKFPCGEHLLVKATFLHASCMDAGQLGLYDHSTYAFLLGHVTTVIHCAWPVTFNLPLQSPEGPENGDANFECHLSITRRLIDFTDKAVRNPQLVFISSLASVSSHVHPEAWSVPERIIEDPCAPGNNGYSRSKWLAERIIGMAAERNQKNRYKIIRLGQITGSSSHARSEQGGNGGTVWAVNELIPSMIRSSSTIGALPANLHAMEKIRWTTVDDAAAVILDVVEYQEEDELACASTFNVTNIAFNGSERIWKDDILPLVKARMEGMDGPGTIEIVSMQEWLRRVERQGIACPKVVRQGETSGYSGKASNPAFRLLGFYEALIGFKAHGGLDDAIETGRTNAASLTFRNLQPVDPVWMEDWMAAWGL